jgi:hypothetical protein
VTLKKSVSNAKRKRGRINWKKKERRRNAMRASRMPTTRGSDVINMQRKQKKKRRKRGK